MEKQDYYINLYDYYGSLLSEKQQKYFEYYFFDNLSLSEISDLLNISRNAVHKTLKTLEEKLDFYEKKLQLFNKRKQLNIIIENLDEKIKKQLQNLY